MRKGAFRPGESYLPMRLHLSDTWLHRPEGPAVAVVGRRPGLAQPPILQTAPAFSRRKPNPGMAADEDVTRMGPRTRTRKRERRAQRGS